jgi:sensor histidine kinase YesM
VHPILADRRRLQLHLAASAIVGATLALLVRVQGGTPWWPAIAFGLPLGLVAASVSLSAWYVCRAMPLSRTPILRVAVAAGVAALVSASIWAAIGRIWWQLLTQAGLEMRTGFTVATSALLVGLGGLAYLLALVVQYLIQAFEESADAAHRALESQVGQREAELRALRAQVDPHFLFNSLNSISGLIGADPARARQMCHMLGDFLRDSLRLGSTARIPLGREVALAEQYLRVEQVRFGARLEVRTTVSPASAEVPVPSLILQPLVENAVRHGVGTRLDGGLIEIQTLRAGARATIVVSNPRDADGARRGLGFGQDIVRRRLAASFGDRATLTIESTDDAYRVSLTVPVEEAST